jgi:hypothetical protein
LWRFGRFWCGIVPVGHGLSGCLRRHRAGIEEPLAAFREPAHIAGEREAARDDAQSGTLGEE